GHIKHHDLPIAIGGDLAERRSTIGSFVAASAGRRIRHSYSGRNCLDGTGGDRTERGARAGWEDRARLWWSEARLSAPFELEQEMKTSAIPRSTTSHGIGSAAAAASARALTAAVVGLLSASLPAIPAAAQSPPKDEIIAPCQLTKVFSVEAGDLSLTGDALAVRAGGTASTAAWTHAALVETGRSADGAVLTFEFVACPPPDFAAEVMTPISAEATLAHVADVGKLRSVVIVAGQNQKELTVAP
ncbi:MAG: hypothetical protein ACLPSW_26580, partial [Roseiarcus sp.]